MGHGAGRWAAEGCARERPPGEAAESPPSGDGSRGSLAARLGGLAVTTLVSGLSSRVLTQTLAISPCGAERRQPGTRAFHQMTFMLVSKKKKKKLLHASWPGPSL